jgi:hypothetical protein
MHIFAFLIVNPVSCGCLLLLLSLDIQGAMQRIVSVNGSNKMKQEQLTYIQQ